jgi:hypothetical protein
VVANKSGKLVAAEHRIAKIAIPNQLHSTRE